MLDRPILRRTISVSMLVVAATLLFLLLPVILLIAVVIDVVRWLAMRRPWMTVRTLAFGLLYLIGELWAVASLAFVVILGRSRSIELTYRLQRAWAHWNFKSVELVFGLRFDVTGAEAANEPPFILLARHASLIDTLLPAEFVTRPFEVPLRYVLKKELLVDPALDIAGSRLPNFFIDRGAGESDSDRAGIRDLATTMSDQEAVLIYPEGTRFSEEKSRRFRSRFAQRDDTVSKLAVGLRHVLPPRPGGTLAILDASDADVVTLAHHGLEGFASVKDIWAGDLVGKVISVNMIRIPRNKIPQDRAGRVEWLFKSWAELDNWVEAVDARV